MFVEKILHVFKIHVPKDCYQAKLAHDWQEALDHTRSVKRTRRDTANPHGFVIVLLEDSCQGRASEGRITMIVFRSYYDESVATLDGR